MQMADVLRQQMTKLRETMLESLAHGQPLDADNVLEMTRKHMLIGRYAAQMAVMLQQVDKLQRGEPNSILRVEASEGKQMPLEEAVQTIDRAKELVDMARQEGWLQVERMVPPNQRIIIDSVSTVPASTGPLTPLDLHDEDETSLPDGLEGVPGLTVVPA